MLEVQKAVPQRIAKHLVALQAQRQAL
jgi:hypothetical protein